MRFYRKRSFQLLGLAAYSVVILLAVAGWNRFWCHKVEAGWSKNFGLVSTLLSLAGLLALSLQEVPLKGVLLPAGGAVGYLLAAYLSYALGEAGAFILLVTTLFAAIMVATRWSLSQGVKRVSAWQRAKAADLITAFAHFRESRRKEKLRNRVVKKHARRALDAAKNKAKPKDDPVARVEQTKAKPNKQEMLPFTPKKGRWSMPPYTILESRPEETKLDDKELMERAKVLQARCREFAVDGQVLQIHPGPVVTTVRVQTGRRYQVQQDHRPSPRTSASLYKASRFASIASLENRRSESRSQTPIERSSVCESFWSRKSFSRAPHASRLRWAKESMAPPTSAILHACRIFSSPGPPAVVSRSC